MLKAMVAMFGTIINVFENSINIEIILVKIETKADEC
jgi:hypothetical protein